MNRHQKEILAARGTIPLWVIAEKLNVPESTLASWIGKTLNAEKKVLILNTIEEIKTDLESKFSQTQKENE